MLLYLKLRLYGGWQTAEPKEILVTSKIRDEFSKEIINPSNEG